MLDATPPGAVDVAPPRAVVAYDAMREVEPLPPREEQALLGPGATAKRRRDFYAGRRVARAALGAALPGRSFVVLREDGAAAGRPLVCAAVLTPQALPEVHLSITHVDGFAAAACAPTPVGIDLVTREPLSEALIAEVFTARERDGWREGYGALADFHCIAFAAKEAALKILGTGLRAALHEVEVLPGAPEAATFAALEVETRVSGVRFGAAVVTPGERREVRGEGIFVPGQVIVVLGLV